MYCTIHVAKTKALISFVVTTKLICVFVFAYAISRFSHDEAQMTKIIFNVSPDTTLIRLLKISKCKTVSSFI